MALFNQDPTGMPGSPAALLALLQAARSQPRRAGPLAAPAPRPVAPAAPQGPLAAPSPGFNAAFAAFQPPAAIPGIGNDPLGNGVPGDRTAPNFADVGPIGGGPAALPASAVPAMAPEAHVKRGVFDRIGDFVGSDDGKAALFRAGATMLAGGNIGQGALAGAGEVDRRKKLSIDEQHYQTEKGQRDRQLDISKQGADQQGLYQAGSLQNSANQNMIDVMRANEAARHNAAAEGHDWAKLGVEDQNNRVQAELKRMDIAKDIRGQDVSAATTQRGQDITADTTRYGVDSARHTADENRAYQYGPEVTTKNYDDQGNQTTGSTARRPNFGQVRSDGKGNFYRLDSFTGRPVLVTPSATVIRRGPLAQ